MFGNESWVDKFKSLDVYGKLPKGYLQPTVIGACLSLLTFGLMAYLFLFEFTKYFEIITTSHMLVDLSRGSDKLKINLDIEMHKLPCYVLSLDMQDFMGSHGLNVKGNLIKTRIDKNGQSIGKYIEVEAKKKSGEKHSHDDEDDEVMPDYLEVKNAFQKEEGCRVAGYFEVLRVPGNFHISSHAFGPILQKLATEGFAKMDLSHTIHHISFGDEKDIKHIQTHFNTGGILNPLDGATKMEKEPNKIYEYYLGVVRTTYQDVNGNIFKVNQFTANNNEMSVHMTFPAVFFRYDNSPIVVQVTQENPNKFHIFVNVCAIFGGMFTLAGILDTFLLKLTRIGDKRD